MQLTKRIDDIGVVPLIRTPADVLHTLDGCHRRSSIKSSTGDRVERIGYRQDPRAKRNDVSFHSSGVPASVPSLVVVPNQWRDFGKGGVLSDHVGPYVGMATHDFPFRLGERTRFVEDVVPHPDLPEVVE